MPPNLKILVADKKLLFHLYSIGVYPMKCMLGKIPVVAYFADEEGLIYGVRGEPLSVSDIQTSWKENNGKPFSILDVKFSGVNLSVPGQPS